MGTVMTGDGINWTARKRKMIKIKAQGIHQKPSEIHVIHTEPEKKEHQKSTRNHQKKQ